MNYEEMTKRINACRIEMARNIPWRVAMQNDALELMKVTLEGDAFSSLFAMGVFMNNVKNGKYKAPENFPPGSFGHFKQVWDSIE